MALHKMEALRTGDKGRIAEVTSFPAKIPIAELLSQSGQLTTKSAQVFGYCPFSVDRQNRLSFRWISLPTFFVFFQLGLIASWLVFYQVFEDKFEAMYASQVKNTDKFGYLLVKLIGGLVQSYLRLSAILTRRKTLVFWDKTNCILRVRIYN
jgi:hypothetical protein